LDRLLLLGFEFGIFLLGGDSSSSSSSTSISHDGSGHGHFRDGDGHGHAYDDDGDDDETDGEGDGDDGEMIGIGGCTTLSSPVFGWPAVGYQIRREHWGRGYATEFLTGWLELWCALPRGEVEISVGEESILPYTSVEDGTVVVPEMVTAFALSDNVASQRVLQKAGFETFVKRREADLRDPEREIELRGYRYFVGQGR
jgi:hypothetical protein